MLLNVVKYAKSRPVRQVGQPNDINYGSVGNATLNISKPAIYYYYHYYCYYYY